MSDFKTRLYNEKSELSDKVEKLESFINGENFKSVDVHQQYLLKSQVHAMRAYLMILQHRIFLLEPQASV